MANTRELELHSASELEQELIREQLTMDTKYNSERVSFFNSSKELLLILSQPLDAVRRHSRMSDISPVYSAPPREQRISTLSPNLGMLDPFGYGFTPASQSPYDTALQYSANSSRNRASQFGRPASNPNSRYPSSSDISTVSNITSSTAATSPIPWRNEEIGPAPSRHKARSASLGEEERGGPARSRLGYVSSGLASEIEVEVSFCFSFLQRSY